MPIYFLSIIFFGSSFFIKKLHWKQILCRFSLYTQNLHRKRLRALSLIEISFTLLIMGILTTSGIYLLNIFSIHYKQYINKQKHQTICLALGAYASRTQHLPFPAVDKKGISQAELVQKIGFVPWKTLGLTQEAGLDAYDQPIKYIMHPALGPQKIHLPLEIIENTQDFKDDEQSSTMEQGECAQSSTMEQHVQSTNKQEPSAFSYLANEPEHKNFIRVFYGDDEYDAFTCFDSYKVIGQYIQYKDTGKVVDINGSGVNACVSAKTALYNKVQGRPHVCFDKKICDFIAFALISGPFDLSDKGQSEYHIKIDPMPGKLQTFCTRFNLFLYQGPVCRPIIKNKIQLLEIKHEPYRTAIEVKDTCYMASSFVKIGTRKLEKQAVATRS